MNKCMRRKIAIMQPYFFPYIGYWQLMFAVDTFVILDDVNFIVRGWINRNNILISNKKHLFSIPLQQASQNKLIMDTKMLWPYSARAKFMKTVEIAYRKACCFDSLHKLLTDVVGYDTDDLVDFICNSFIKVLEYLGIERTVVRSSTLRKDEFLRAEKRIVNICNLLNCDMYINPRGGLDLYDADFFKRHGIDLRFIYSNDIRYKQFGDSFVEGLSLIDVLAFNKVDEVLAILQQFRLLEKKELLVRCSGGIKKG